MQSSGSSNQQATIKEEFMAKNLDSLSPAKSDKPADKPIEKPAEAAEKPADTAAAATPAPSEPAASAKAAEAPAASKDEKGEKPVDPTASPATDTFESMFPEPSVTIAGPPSWIWWLLLIIASVGLGLVAYRLLNGRVDSWLSLTSSSTPTASASATPTASGTPAATATPTPALTTPTPAASIDKSAVTLRVLNGTTKAGIATTIKTTLQDAGFTVRTVGNAKTQNYQSTLIYYQTGKLAEAQAVQSALSQYSPTLEESTTLASPDMILVIYGSTQ